MPVHSPKLKLPRIPDEILVPSPRVEYDGVKTRAQTAKESRCSTPTHNKGKVDKSSVVNTPVKQHPPTSTSPPGAPRKQKKSPLKGTPSPRVRKKLNFDEHPYLKEVSGYTKY